MAEPSSFPYVVRGVVVSGFGRGSKKLGCPTANLQSDVVDTITLPNGIYYGFTQLVDTTEPTHSSPVYPMCCSLGHNPHFNNSKRSLEVHIMHTFDEDFYGATLQVAICGHIRPERKFDSLQDLIDAISNDIAFARRMLDVEKRHELVRNDCSVFHL